MILESENRAEDVSNQLKTEKQERKRVAAQLQQTEEELSELKIEKEAVDKASLPLTPFPCMTCAWLGVRKRACMCVCACACVCLCVHLSVLHY